jgi:crossover junction endodeoxyribonuclease RuvC
VPSGIRPFFNWTKMITLGLDASSSKSGWAVVNDTGELIACGEIELSKFHTKRKPLEYLLVTYNKIISLCEEYKPDQVCIEEIYHRNVSTFRTLARVRGVIELACIQSGIDTVMALNASHIRKTVLGSGKLDKVEICSIFEERYSKPLATVGYDQSDAILVALGGALEPKKESKTHVNKKRRKSCKL